MKTFFFIVALEVGFQILPSPPGGLKTLCCLYNLRKLSSWECTEKFFFHLSLSLSLSQLWDTERSDGNISLVHSSSMRQFNWGYTQFSQFNADDTLLLVSGVYLGPHHSSSGEIAVISLGRCRVFVDGVKEKMWPKFVFAQPGASHTARQLHAAVPREEQAL